MLDTIFHGIFDSASTATNSVAQFMICMLCSLLIGLILSLAYLYHGRSTGSFVATLALLPAIVCVVIMMVNGNVGTGVAVAGAFSLVRFRSAAGTAREIGALFLAMAAGLIVGMGYLAFGFLFTIVLGAVSMLLTRIDLGVKRARAKYKTLHVTIPENLDYTGIFDDIFAQYTSECELIHVKSSNMGSLFKLTYQLTQRNPQNEKTKPDAIRVRNGNLELSISAQETPTGEL